MTTPFLKDVASESGLVLTNWQLVWGDFLFTCLHCYDCTQGGWAALCAQLVSRPNPRPRGLSYSRGQNWFILCVMAVGWAKYKTGIKYVPLAKAHESRGHSQGQIERRRCKNMDSRLYKYMNVGNCYLVLHMQKKTSASLSCSEGWQTLSVWPLRCLYRVSGNKNPILLRLWVGWFVSFSSLFYVWLWVILKGNTLVAYTDLLNSTLYFICFPYSPANSTVIKTLHSIFSSTSRCSAPGGCSLPLSLLVWWTFVRDLAKSHFCFEQCYPHCGVNNCPHSQSLRKQKSLHMRDTNHCEQGSEETTKSRNRTRTRGPAEIELPDKNFK
jgi:hypothetical protein